MSAILGRVTPFAQLTQTGDALAGKQASSGLALDSALPWKGRIKSCSSFNEGALAICQSVSCPPDKADFLWVFISFPITGGRNAE